MSEPTPTVYSYYGPETQAAVQTAMLSLNHTQYGIHDTLKQNYYPGLDKLHEPLLRKYEGFARREGVIGLDTFKSKYFTNGSSEGILHLITSLLRPDPLYQFVGEYQGYEAYAEAVGRRIVTVRTTDELMERPPGILFVSNPRSQDGSLITNDQLREWGDRHGIVVDLAYMGATREPLNLDLTNPRIVAVLGSLSKPFGMYYFRVGFCYSRIPINSLFANVWFKNALSIRLGEAVLDHYHQQRMDLFKDKMFRMQEEAVAAANEKFGFTSYNEANQIKPSPVWLLGTLVREDAAKYDPDDIRAFKRVDGWNDRQPSIWRFCLTPYYMEKEDQ